MNFELQGNGDIVVRIPHREDRPYNPLLKALYTPDQLMTGWDSKTGSLDQRIADYYVHEGGQSPKDPSEALCQRIHDDFIDRLVVAFIKEKGEGDPQERKLIGIMGGHVQDRTTNYYSTIASIGYQLTRRGYTVVTGGGPGVMEAANLGAYMSSYTTQDLSAAISTLAQAPNYPPSNSSDPSSAVKRKQYVEAALKVREIYPKGAKNLGIPTWAYSDEPTGQFATHIAKYFANSIREDGLLAIAVYGVIFAPGGAGTAQEIFQDAAHNSYMSFGSQGPMVFLGTDVYRRSPSLYDVALAAANRDGYSDFLALVDDAPSALSFIQRHPPKVKKEAVRTLGLTRYVYTLPRQFRPRIKAKCD
jgi:predicted Rossmann-fold nucleotide-binding protein